ncbi:MAG: hypothetical protein ACE5D1_05385 [Fidelibacterota bacterium]
MKSCLTNNKIEALALGRSLPDAEEHVKNCLLCRERLKTAREFLQQVESGLNAPPDPREIQLSSPAGFPSGKWIATPIQTLVPTFRPSVYAAATTVDLPKREINRVGLLATPDQDILIRVLHYTTSGEVKLFLVSDQKRKIELVLIKIPAIGFEGVTTVSGVINLGRIDPCGWNEWQVEIHTPKAIYNLTALEDSGGRIHASRDVRLSPDSLDHLMVECEQQTQENSLSIHVTKMNFDSADQNRVYRILVTRGKTVLGLRTTESGKIQFPGIHLEPGLQIRVFE